MLTKISGLVAAVCGLAGLSVGQTLARAYRDGHYKLGAFAKLYVAQVSLALPIGLLIVTCCLALLALRADTPAKRAGQTSLLFLLCLLCVPPMSTVFYFSSTMVGMWSSFQ